MADAGNLHPTAGRRRRDKGPPSTIPSAPGALPRLERVNDTESERSDDSAGEKEAKRQRSEPTTPVSTSSRLPYEYDALMGITRVGTKEAEGFDEDLGTPEYHDATEEPAKREETDDLQPELRSMGFQGGYGSSSLKECIDLLNAKPRHAPAPLDSGVDQDSVNPPHFLIVCGKLRLPSLGVRALAPFGVFACCSLVLFFAPAWFSGVVDVVAVDCWLLVVGCWLLVFLPSQNPIWKCWSYGVCSALPILKHWMVPTPLFWFVQFLHLARRA